MAVDVGVRDLIRSYVALRDSATETNGSPAYLLLCYGVECGMKAAYLRKRGKRAQGTQDLPDNLRNHDLLKIAKELRLDAGLTSQLSACHRSHDGHLTVAPQELHEAWRYGATLKHEDEKGALAALNNLSEWCRKEHSR